MTKPSEVLRLAAEYALSGCLSPISEAITYFDAWNFSHMDIIGLTFYCGYSRAKTPEERCMTLCFAAAIAEYKGN